MGLKRRLEIHKKYPKMIKNEIPEIESHEESKPDYKGMFDARKGFWIGNVKIGFNMRHPQIKGYCTNCGRQMVDYDRMYSDDEISLCSKCFDLFERFTPVLIHHYPGCVENGGEYDIHVWKGYDEFVKRHPPMNGWHYELSTYNRLMDVSDDHQEYWVLWHVRDESIIEELKTRIPIWKHP